MNFRKYTVWPLLGVALLLPASSYADSMWHPAGGDVGFTYHPEHIKSTKTRAEVVQELEAARNDGTLARYQNAAPIPIKNAGPGKTRQQVIDDMRSEAAADRRARASFQMGG